MPAAPVASVEPLTPLSERVFELPDEAASLAFGERFANALRATRAGLHVHLLGDLGAGKTTLVRATLHALGHTGRVRSPTYTLVEPYRIVPREDDVNELEAPRVYDIYHFDLYRFADPAEWIEAGFREYFDGHALCLVEWPQKAGALIGAPDLSLSLDLAGEGRVLTARAYSARGKDCLDRC
ncbi:tRNA (adenosine(37)-N6)-threonylcarbamoyltransferase complex ATPase subunit type 1 TsaE [Pararobbsia silviterrae]|uniref:tRNA threonylcarbamoyladenosine biosynthesis protein TsaE n=1 Tax=Pararobbsia silviterrae TaxID=1792498 RepID=A0A494XG21_9BURK|nr:tRNA (adenosine(37)-N6)-threonylcarbamoyltransferase complex ATPase subunit type 1 TsaE [Pararobbsia silviterrae]RKP48641.1 tRNA (adenosine(37)-N6)-threonylcarbamoyltransferase complex ATPase subunit type 1 TsaE [Pararobbsia silviterrae]